MGIQKNSFLLQKAKLDRDDNTHRAEKVLSFFVIFMKNKAESRKTLHNIISVNY